MKTKMPKLSGNTAGRASVLECGSPLPLSLGLAASPISSESARGLAHSKTWRTCAALLVFLAVALAAHAQYSIDWFTIDGGGTIGQPDAGGPLTNGQYSVTGGFWALPTAVQVIGAPTFTIVPATPGNANLSWTPNTPGFVLHQTAVLSPANWTNSHSGATNPIIVPASTPTRFYRLFKP